MDELVVEFKSEAKDLAGQLLEILESVEGNFSQIKKLETFGQVVDRIMGTAKNMAVMDGPAQPSFSLIGNYCEICKIVGYKCSQITNENLFTVTVALLLDATETLQEMIERIGEESLDINVFVQKPFLERLRWVAGQFPADLRATLGDAQNLDIDKVLKSMGL